MRPLPGSHIGEMVRIPYGYTIRSQSHYGSVTTARTVAVERDPEEVTLVRTHAAPSAT